MLKGLAILSAVSGYVKYRTIFGPEIYESRFCDYFNHTPTNLSQAT
jgi:hypothetical protein